MKLKTTLKKKNKNKRIKCYPLKVSKVSKPQKPKKNQMKKYENFENLNKLRISPTNFFAEGNKLICCRDSFLILFYSSSSDKNLKELFMKYYQIWPPFQWITSLLTLVLIYWISGYFYNKFLSNKGGWMDAKARIIMITVDLLLNFSLGIYYMNYRETLMGALMMKCPVFISPLFWCVELICFYIYYRYIYVKGSKENQKKNH